MTSSLRNSLYRRNHKERSQLAHRARFGILEKHKDYVLRARDYHSKQDRLKRLRQIAAQRNKDEFYFSMTKERTQGGVHVKERGNVALPVDIVKVLKTQDENYVRTVRAAGLKKIDKIKNNLTALANLVKPSYLDRESDNSTCQLDEEEAEILRQAGIIPGPPRRKDKGRRPTPKHVIFVENDDQAKQYTTQKKTLSDDDRTHVGVEEIVDLGWMIPNDKKAKKRRPSSVSETNGEAEYPLEVATHHRKQLLKELSARLARDKQLRYAEREFEMQRLLMGRGARRKLRGIEKIEGGEDGGDHVDDDSKRREKSAAVNEKTYKPRVYKWRLERKR